MLQTHYFLLPIKTTFWTIYTLFFPNHFIDPNFGIPMIPCLDMVSGFLCFIGLILAIFSIDQWISLVALIGFIIGVIANSLAVQGPNPVVQSFAGLRSFLILPFLFLMIGIALEWIYQWWRTSNLKKNFRRIIKIGWTMLLIIVCYVNINIYFFKFRNSVGEWNALGFNHIETALIFKRYYPHNNILVRWDLNSSVEQFLDFRNHVKVNMINTLKLPFDFKTTKKHVVLILPTYQWPRRQTEIKKLYPKSHWKLWKNKFGQPFLYAITIPGDEIQARQIGIQCKRILQ